MKQNKIGTVEKRTNPVLKNNDMNSVKTCLLLESVTFINDIMMGICHFNGNIHGFYPYRQYISKMEQVY